MLAMVGSYAQSRRRRCRKTLTLEGGDKLNRVSTVKSEHILLACCQVKCNRKRGSVNNNKLKSGESVSLTADSLVVHYYHGSVIILRSYTE